MKFQFGDIVEYTSQVKARIINKSDDYFIQGNAIVIHDFEDKVEILTPADTSRVMWPKSKLKLIRKNTFDFNI